MDDDRLRGADGRRRAAVHVGRQSLSSGAWLLLPLALCLGMHFLMHRHVGHDQRDRDE